MKRLLLILPIFLSACAPAPVRVDMPGTDQSASVPVEDLRSADEKKSEIFSLMITSSGYGIYRKGDDSLDPPMTQVFRRLAYERIANGQSPIITIYHMVVYMNAKSELRRGAVAGGIGGLIGGAIAAGMSVGNSVNVSQSVVDRTQFENAPADEYQRAFYTDAENPEHASVFVIYIDAAVNGKRVFVKTMAPTKAPEGQNAYSLAIQSSIQYYLSQYVGTPTP